MAIRLLALDVDGVLTDGTLYYTAYGEEMKAFHAHDGLGMKLLHKLGVEIAVISGRKSAALEKRLDDLGITHRRLRCADKVTALAELASELELPLEDVAFMGDDLIDMGAMLASGYAIAPANAVDDVKAIADYVSPHGGGHGAVRDACEHLARQLDSSLKAAAEGETRILVQ
ncbi:KdsC family phosphatase [Kordiimonas aestuarii]|uniref:KdsC family phosphatase n=1 Tax=Kordiimonas aestuarii TaxID=1005925 RepID=UPI0021D24CBA|nr:HAD-IIIA family hydrolase [Kordiimonas aestuarii]